MKLKLICTTVLMIILLVLGFGCKQKSETAESPTDRNSQAETELDKLMGKSLAEAYARFAGRGEVNSQYNLGNMYENGDYLPQDYNDAVKWYTKAAEQGHAGAQLKLGVMYVNGQGVPEDYIQAYKWYNLAAAQGDETAKKNRDILRRRMTPAQVAEAQRLSREFVPKKAEQLVEVMKTSVKATNKESGKVLYRNDSLCFSIEIPKDWNSSKLLLSHAFAPKYVTIKKVGGQEILKQFATQNGKTGTLDTEEGAIIDELFAGFQPVHDGSLQWLVIMNAGSQKHPVIRACQAYISGARVYDKSYKASEPKEVALTNLANRCAYFTEEVSGDGSTEKGLVIMVPHDDGYILMLQFRADPKSFDENWDAWWKIAKTLRIFSAN